MRQWTEELQREAPENDPPFKIPIRQFKLIFRKMKLRSSKIALHNRPINL